MDDFLNKIETYKDEFYRYIYRNVWDSGIADDVFSSAILVAYQKQKSFRQGSNFRAWMYKILTNKCFSANKETNRKQENIEDFENSFIALSEDSTYNNILEDPEDFLSLCGDEVFIAFRVLSTSERSCILLKGVESFSYKEISEILEIPVGTVMTHLSRGRTKLRKELLSYAKSEGIIGRKFYIKENTDREDVQRKEVG